MRYIKTYYAYILVTVVFCSTVSCKKLLNIPANPSDRIAAEQAFSDSANLLSVMSGIYLKFGLLDYFVPSFHNGGISVYPGLSSDELINLDIINNGQAESPFFFNALLPGNDIISNFWEAAYSSIYSINAALEGIEASNGLSADLKQRLTGELKTVRALYFFNLVNLFGGVPLITGTDFATNAKLPRSSVDEVYELIVADLEEATTVLKPEYPIEGRARPNLYTAKALLAKVYLYRENWEKAATLSGEVINDGLYSLEPDLNNVFLHGSSESIWQLPANGTFIETVEGYLFVPGEDIIPRFELTSSLFDAFEPDDQRKVNWVAEATVDSVRYYQHPYKYKKNYPAASSTIEDYSILRLGEQYLIRAEALAHLDRLSDALDNVNVIRQRAGLTDRSLTDKETLLADIMHERRIELFCEWGNRWYDLKRTGMANTVLGTKPDWQPEDELYPIPLNQLQTNPFLRQNPGY